MKTKQKQSLTATALVALLLKRQLLDQALLLLLVKSYQTQETERTISLPSRTWPTWINRTRSKEKMS